MQLVAAMAQSGKPLSELACQMEIFPQKLINVPVACRPEIVSLGKVAAAVKQAERELADEGRVLVRYSGTENVCRVMVEAPSNELAQKHCQNIADAVKSEIGKF